MVIQEVIPDKWEEKAIKSYQKRKNEGKLEYIIPTKDYFKSLKKQSECIK